MLYLIYSIFNLHYLEFILYLIYSIVNLYYQRKFRSQTSDNMDRWKAELGRGREKRRVEERRSEKRKNQKKADADARKGRKVAKHCVFQMIWSSGGSKSRLAKAAGAEPAGQMRDEQLHAVVARSTFRSENVQNTAVSDHFWKLRRRQSARRCGAKHISESKCTKHTSLAPLLEVEMFKECTPLWREAHFEVKMLKTQGVRTTFWRFRCRKSARRCGAKHISKSKVQKTEGYGALFDIQMLLRVAGARDCAPCQKSAKREDFVAFSTTTTTTPHYTPNTLHSITLHYTTLHYTTFHYTTLHYTTLHYLPPLHYIPLHYTTLHYTTLPSTTLHYTTLHSTTLHYITLHYTTQHYNYNYTPLHSATLHYTPLH